MGRLILVAAESGSGKSTSLRNLNPKETFVIKPNRKPLPFTGGRKSYSEDSGNLFITNSLIGLKSAILNVNDKAPHVKNLVVEDFFHFMLAKSMDDIKKPGFGKFADLGKETYDATAGLEGVLRDDLNLIIITHTTEEKDASGMPKTTLKLTGRFVADVVDLPSFFTYVLEAKISYVDGKPEYRFLTNKRSDADIAKTPMGMFDELLVDNDMEMIISVLDEKE